MPEPLAPRGLQVPRVVQVQAQHRRQSPYSSSSTENETENENENENENESEAEFKKVQAEIVAELGELELTRSSSLAPEPPLVSSGMGSQRQSVMSLSLSDPWMRVGREALPPSAYSANAKNDKGRGKRDSRIGTVALFCMLIPGLKFYYY